MKKMFSAFLGAIVLVGTSCFGQPESPGVMLGAYIPATVTYTDTILAFDENTEFDHTHTLMFCRFDYDFDGYPQLLDQIRDAGKIPIVTWQPGVSGVPDPSFSNSSFLNGDHDLGIISMAYSIKGFIERSENDSGIEIYIRFAHEPNISSAPAWPGHQWNNQSTQDYIDMFRYVHDLFYEVLGDLGDRVVWTWSVNYLGSAEGLDTYSNWKNLYPGDDYVDMVGLSGLNYGDHPTAGPGYSVTVQWLYMPILREMMAGGYVGGARVGETLRELASISGGKPQGIFEFGSVGGFPGSRSLSTYSTIPKEDWILQGYDSIREMVEFNYVRLIIWYNGIATSGGYLSDFRVSQNPGREEGPVPESWTQAYRDAIRGGGGTFFLEEPLTLEEMTPGEFYQAPSLITEKGYPQHEFWLSVYPGGELQRGAGLVATYFLYPSAGATPTNPDVCDGYVAVKIPGGKFYAFVPPASWVPFSLGGEAPQPAVKNFHVKRQSSATAFSMTLGSNLPAGTYKFYSILVPPGADPRNGGPDLKTTTFVLTE